MDLRSAAPLVFAAAGVLLLLFGLAGSPGALPAAAPPLAAMPAPESPPANIHRELRQSNWSQDGGSCGHASTISALRWADQLDAANRWRRSEGGGVTERSLRAAFGRHGVEYAMTNRGDESFLDWLTENRMMATIWYFPRHAVNFVGFDGDDAVLLDNNRTQNWIRIPRSRFLRDWRGYGGFAIAPLHAPTMPRPYQPYQTE